MKKLFLFIIIAAILIIPLSSAIQSDIKENYKLGETIITKVSGNFLQNIEKQNIYFYRRYMPTTFPDYGVKKIGNDFYVYAKVPLEKTPDNYSIHIKNVRHMEFTKIVYNDIVLNFTIINETADFSVYPGVIISDRNFFIQVQNLLDNNLEIGIGASENQSTTTQENSGGFFDFLFKKKSTENVTTPTTPESISLLPGETKKIEFVVAQTEFKFIELSSTNQTYEIPAYLTFNSSAINNTNETINQTILDNGTIIINENITENNGTVIIIDENLSEGNKTIIFEKKCMDIGGKICADGDICNGTEINSSDTFSTSPCCKGECQTPAKSNTGKIVGIALLIVVFIIIFFIIKSKLKKKNKPVDLLKIGSKK